LGTSDESEAAIRAMRIYRAVVNQGWASANAHFPRELSLALRWQDNPLAWTYTTIHTRQESGPLKPVVDQADRPPETSVVFIEPDAGIRFALAACANSQEGFRCDTTFAGAAEALREMPRRRVDLALANHDVPDEQGVARLEELQRVRPCLTVLSYSVFEDADQLFKSTPGGAVVYMLKRTSPCRIFEPIAKLAGSATHEQIASHVREYFQHLSALLPSGPPFWKLAKLTPREHEILAFLSKGDLIKEIADTLGISNWTVHDHVKRIFEKLNVHTRTEAVIKYLQK
jgi:DNA-binding NarL/FixJ family response regulator